MSEPGKIINKSVERLSVRERISGTNIPIGETVNVNVRRNRTEQETRDQYMRLMGNLQNQWRSGVNPRDITERQRRLTQAYTRTMMGLSATNRGWESWTKPAMLINKRNNRRK